LDQNGLLDSSGTAMTHLRSTLLAALGGLVATGCAFLSPASLPAGASVGEATKALGKPTGEYTLPTGGKRLEFARGPYGKHTWMLDFDAGGALKTTTQVLTEPNFNAVRAGMGRDDVLLAIGRPSETSRLVYQHQTVWSYRYESPFCQWFQVGIDERGRVADSGYYPDPLCEDNMSDRAGM
jgi:hypothetical protein